MSEPIFAQKFQPSPDASGAAVGGAMIFLHLSKGVYLEVDEIGTIIWEKLTSGHLLSDICSEIASEYDTPLGLVRKDAVEFVAQLQNDGLIEVVEQTQK